MGHVLRAAVGGNLQGRWVTSMMVLVLPGHPDLRELIAHLCGQPAAELVQALVKVFDHKGRSSSKASGLES